MTEDDMVGWYHQFNGHEFEEALELVMDREVWLQSMGSKELDMTERLNCLFSPRLP